MSERTAKRILLLGWDGADWRIIQPLIDAGKMPFLKSFIERGTMGNLATLQPILSPMLWTSVATGKRADKHGVYGFVEPRPDGKGVRPVSSTTLACRPIWDILTAAGLGSAVVGWYATHPADKVGGTAVSNHFHMAKGMKPREWTMPERCVAPAKLEDEMRELRVHPRDLLPEQFEFFVPEMQRIDWEKDKRALTMARLIAGCASVHNAATRLMERDDWDLLGVYFETIDRVCHDFMWYAPPRMEHVGEEDFELYQHAVERTYIYHDLMLGRCLDLVGPETTVIIISDHGFFQGDMRPRKTGDEEKPPPLSCHRPYGVFAAAGPGVRQDELVFGASLLDIAPTLLWALGLPVGRDMEGLPLARIFEQPSEPEYIDTHETGERAVARGGEEEDDPWLAREAVKQLVDLGYMEAASEDEEKAVEGALNQKLSNLAEVHISKGEFDQALPMLEELLARRPNLLQARLRLAQSRLMTGDVDGCRELLGKGLPNPEASGVPHLLHGMLEFHLHNYAQALEHFRAAEKLEPGMPALQQRIGHIHMREKRFQEAEQAFTKSMDVDGESPSLFRDLGTAQASLNKLEEAELSLMRSLGLLFHQPMVHFRLGQVLAARGKLQPAAISLERALQGMPGYGPAHALLARVCKRLGRKEEAMEHERLARSRQKEKAQDQ
jgi:predicted AlkP superfamily phosphohydrolase/phosphomutase/tetratricopeptide (TPR) repeat protein